MSMGFMRAQDAAVRHVVFGKLPRRDDFVRLNAAHPLAEELDRLLAASLAWASRQPGWDDEVYFAQRPSNFQFTSSDGRWVLLGALVPSRDLAGRAYPLVAGLVRPVSDVARSVAEQPIANELFYAGLREQLASAIDNSVELLACRQFLDAQVALSARAEAEADLARSVLERHLYQTTAAQLQHDLHESGCGSLELHVLALVFYLALLRRYEGSAPSQAIILPLPARAGEDVLAQAAWLALYRAASGPFRMPLPQCVTLTLSGRPYLALVPDRFNERLIAGLWGLPLDPASVIEVEDRDVPWARHHAYAEASYILSRQLADPALTLHALCEVIGRLARGVS